MTERRPGDIGPQSARQWLIDFGWELADPSEVSPEELDTILDHDEFWDWCSGKVDFNALSIKSQKEAELSWGWYVFFAVCFLVAYWFP